MILHVTNDSVTCLPPAREVDLFLPEMGKTPKEVLEMMGHLSVSVNTIATTSEHIVLWLLHKIRSGQYPASYYQIIYHGNGFSHHPLRIDEHGEFIDRWPGGFFNERAALLF